jgi:nitroreductase
MIQAERMENERFKPVPSGEAEVLRAIYSRRSVRQYSPEKVDEKTVRRLLDAAIHAPSAMNSQPWSFVVIQKPELLKKISDQAKALIQKSAQWHPSAGHCEHGFAPLADPKFNIFYDAQMLVVICAEKTGFGPTGDCYLAGENLMLAACSMGLATCPIGFARDILQTEEWKRVLGIPTESVPVLPIIIGYPVEMVAPTERRAPRILKWVR